MSEQIKVVAMRLRELREIEDISLDAMAAEFGIPAADYAAYESGTVDIPVSFLYEAAQRFNVELIAILSGDYPKLHIYQHVKKGKGLAVERSKQYRYQSLAFNFSNKKAEPFMVTVEPETDIIHTNSHPGQEFNYCLEGRMKISINRREIILEEGDSIYYDSTYPHGMCAMDGKPAKFLAVIM